MPDLPWRARFRWRLLPHHVTADGKNNREIAEGLYLSLKTVRNYVSSIFAKLRVADRAGAIVRAREVGLGRDRPWV